VSVTPAEQTLARARKTLVDHRRKQAEAEKNAAALDKAAASKEASARSSRNPSTMQNYLKEALRKRTDADKVRAKAAGYSADIAKAQRDVHAAEDKLAKARRVEEKKRRDKEKHEADKRDREEKRLKQEAQRAAKRAAEEHARAERERRWADMARDQEVQSLQAELAEAQATLANEPWNNLPRKVTVLFITAEPEGVEHLRVDKEVREIQLKVRSSELRDSIAFEYRPAARVTDLIQHLNEVEPDIVHFSGHGADAGLAFQDENDDLRLLTNDELDALLKACPSLLKLAVFNSCDSAEQARVASGRVPAAVGMAQSIEDEAARVFAGQLYNALGFGRSLGLAFEQAKLQVQLTLGELSGQPELVVAEGVEPDELFVVAAETQVDEDVPEATSGRSDRSADFT